MKLYEFKIDQEGLKRVRSQPFVNTAFALRDEFVRTGLSLDFFLATVGVAIAKELTGHALIPPTPEFLADVAAGESGAYIGKLIEELLAGQPDGGARFPYDVNAPGGVHIEIRNEPFSSDLGPPLNSTELN